MAIGDLIRDPEARFLIVKRPKKMPKEAWLAFMGPKNSSLLLAAVKKDPSVKLNESCFVNFPYGSETYSVEICLEKATEALGIQVDRDICEKGRRKVVGTGKFERTTAPEKTDAVFTMKNLWRVLKWDNWSDHREATAGADAHEAVYFNRCLIDQILNGNFSKIPQNFSQKSVEYFGAVQVADVAGLPGSYNNDPRFLQCVRIQGLIYEKGRDLYKGSTLTPLLQSGCTARFNWGKHDHRFDHLTQNVFETYEGWRTSLNQFLHELDLPINARVKEAFGEKFLFDLGEFSQALNQFVTNTPPFGIRPVLTQRNAIARLAAGRPLTQVETVQLSSIWSTWKQGKTSQETDRLLGETMTAIQGGLKLLAPTLLKVSVPVSSKKFGTEICEAIQTYNPDLMALYSKAIPPILTNKVKLKTAMSEILPGIEFSPTWLQALDMFAGAESEVIENEFQRSALSKAFMASRKHH